MFTFTQLKELKEIANGDFQQVRDAVEQINTFRQWDTFGTSGETTIRMIHRDIIDAVMKEELSDDPYILGCFNAWFLAGIESLNLDEQFIKDLQESESFEAIGELIIRTPGALDELVEDFIDADGYGHHFNHWDGDEYEVGDFYVFNV